MKKPLISFEFYPPKTEQGLTSLLNSAVRLDAISPDFFSITFGAGGSTQEGTIEAIQMLQQKTQTHIVPHISCVGFNRVGLINILKQYQALGVNRIVALRGDLPSGMGSLGELRYASELVQLIREETGDHFHIEVAAYPECHPQAKTAQHDIQNLKRKFQAGANGAITQYFFNADAYFYFLDACAKEKITMPIIPGIMPILNFNKLARFSDNCGAEIPQWLYKRLESYDEDSAKLFLIDVVYNLCQKLIEGGAPGLHFYTFNHADLSLQILDMLNFDKLKVKQVG